MIAVDLAAASFTASNDGVQRISAARVELVPAGASSASLISDR